MKLTLLPLMAVLAASAVSCRAHCEATATSAADTDTVAVSHTTHHLSLADSLTRRLSVTFDTLDLAIERHSPAETVTMRLRGVKARADTRLVTTSAAAVTVSATDSLAATGHTATSTSATATADTPSLKLWPIVLASIILTIATTCIIRK